MMEFLKVLRFAALTVLGMLAAYGQQRPALPTLPAAQSIPKPAAATDAPYAPQAILQGGIVVPLFPAGSPYLRADKVKEAEVYNMSQAQPVR